MTALMCVPVEGTRTMLLANATVALYSLFLITL